MIVKCGIQVNVHPDDEKTKRNIYMVKHFLTRTAPGIAAAAIFVALPLSCVNEEYDLEKIDTTVQFGGNALVFPLGSTEQLKLQTLLPENEYLQLLDLANGQVWGFRMSDEMDLSGEIPDLASELKIDPVEINESFVEDLGDIDISDLSIEAQTIDNSISFDDVEIPEISVPSEHFENTFSSGIWEYTPSSDQMDLSDDFGNREFSFEGLLDPRQFSDIPGMSGSTPITIPDNLIPEINLATKNTNVRVHIELPDGLSNVRNIELSPNAKMVISMSLLNSFLLSGTVTPEITLDHTELIGLAGESGPLDLSDLVLDQSNGYAAEKSYTIESLSVSETDWNANSLTKEADITAEGRIGLSGISSSLDRINASATQGGLGVLVEVSFEDVAISDMTMDVETIEDEIAPEPFVIDIEPIELPEQVAGVSEVRLADGSGIDIEINPRNFALLGDAFNAGIADLAIQFPQEIVADGLDESNRFILDDVDLTQPTVRHIEVTAIRPEAAENGVITIDGQIAVTGSMTAGGTISLTSLPASQEEDPVVDFIVNTDLRVDDFALTLNPIEHEINDIQDFPIELPDGVGEIGTLNITPEGTPELTVHVAMPELDDIAVKARNIKISFPDMLVFKQPVPAEYNYQESDNSINFNNVEIPENISLDIERIIVTPRLDEVVGSETFGKYVANGEISFTGAATVETTSQDGTVSRADIQALVDNGIQITGAVPAITVSSVNFDKFERTVEQEQPITLLDLDRLPDELESLTVEDVVLYDTELSVTLTTEDIPEMGAVPHIDLAVYLPEEILIDDDRVDENNVLHVSGDLVDNKFSMEPVAISGLDLKNVDFSAGGKIERTIRIEGTISVVEPTINPEELSNAEIKVNVEGGIPSINIERITGYVDYQLGSDGDGNNLNQSISLEDLPDFVKGEDFTLDFENPYIQLTVESNVGIPVKGDLEIIPVFADGADENAAQTISLSIPAAEATGKPLTYWIAASQDGMPAGYKFLQADIPALLKKIPDSIDLRINAGTDSKHLSTIEPDTDYKLALNYEVVVPFVFGEDLDIRMDYTIPGESDDVGEGTDQNQESGALPPILGELLNMNSLGIGGYVESALPLQLELTMDLLDSHGEVIKTEPMSVNIAAGSTEKPSQSPIDIMLKLAEGADGTDLSKIRMNFRVTSGNMSGEPVTDKSYIQAVLKVKVPGGITIDLSSLGESENNTENTDYEN